MKKKVSILLDKEILERAHELGINISKVCENTLKLYIQAIEQARKKEQAFLGEASCGQEGSMEPRAGFGPATPALPRRSPTRLGYRGTIAHASGGTVFYVLKIP
jgi:post-segregation antitoxin (ccd killing protein)